MKHSLLWRGWLVLTLVLLLAATAAWWAQLRHTHQTLLAQQELRTREAAASLALSLSHLAVQQHAEADVLARAAQAALAQGNIHQVRWVAPVGSPPSSSWVQQTPQPVPAVPAVPALLLDLLPLPLPLHVPAARAPVLSAAGEVAELQVNGTPAGTQTALWQAAWQSALAWGAAAVALALLLTALLRASLSPLQRAIVQAQALALGRHDTQPESGTADLRQLTQALNRLAARWREQLGREAERVAQLQSSAQTDAVTGLPQRSHFLGQLQEHLAEPRGAGLALVLVRLCELSTLNQRLGHSGTDGLLSSIGGLLDAYAAHVGGSFAGRLNGSDFGICLPVSGVATETGESLHTALLALPALRSAVAKVAVGAVDGVRGLSVAAALATADAALARAEAEGGFFSDATAGAGSGGAPSDLALAGARAWRTQLADALSDGRTRLAEFAVQDPSGRSLRLECPLQVCLTPHTAPHIVPNGQAEVQVDTRYLAASRWLALAKRSRLMPRVDVAALTLALEASTNDGRARAVHMSWPSLADTGFATQVLHLLQSHRQAAALISIECIEGERSIAWPQFAQTTAPWRALGVRLGLEHAGAAPQELLALAGAGFSYVKLHPRHLHGVAGDAAVRQYAQGLVQLIHSLGLHAVAAGVDDAGDLAALWALGFDAATGPSVAGPAVGSLSRALVKGSVPTSAAPEQTTELVH
jgi:EAL domain-containing protein (putative c-di-GMP-specific phosphodiesterase class I)/GGDEF domain-containing protein